MFDILARAGQAATVVGTHRDDDLHPFCITRQAPTPSRLEPFTDDLQGSRQSPATAATQGATERSYHHLQHWRTGFVEVNEPALQAAKSDQRVTVGRAGEFPYTEAIRLAELCKAARGRQRICQAAELEIASVENIK